MARNEALIKALIDFLVTNKIDVLSVDPFVKTHGVHENDNDGIQAVVECYDDIAEAANCAVHLWHHTRKTGGGEVTIELVRGAIAFVDACRSANVLETMTKAERQRLRIERPEFYFSRVQRQAKLCSNKRGVKLVSSHRCRDRQRWNVFRRRSRCG